VPFQGGLINPEMTTLIFVDKENDEVGATKNQLRRLSVPCRYMLHGGSVEWSTVHTLDLLITVLNRNSKTA